MKLSNRVKNVPILGDSVLHSLIEYPIIMTLVNTAYVIKTIKCDIFNFFTVFLFPIKYNKDLVSKTEAFHY